MEQSAPRTLLIYAPVPLYRKGGALYGEKQALNGMRLWAAHFEKVIVMMPESPEAPPPGWEPLSHHTNSLERVQVEPLPMAYRPDQFFKVLRSTRRKIGDLIRMADYLSFAIGGLFGDWGAVAAFEAERQGRPFAVWTDRVESEVVRRSIGQGTWRHSLRSRLYHRPMFQLEKKVIRRAALGLFHGQETFDTYAPFCRNPHVVHDIHIAPKDHISDEALSDKMDAIPEGQIRIAYVGRADPMKGPMDWLEALALMRDAGVIFQATWLGDGSELEQMRAWVAEKGLTGQVDLPGFTDNRDAVRDLLQQAHIFLFCHKTPESPRCLIEALSAAAPIIGYEGAYARDLISAHQGGVLVPLGDVDALAQAVITLERDRVRLSELIGRAREDGRPFTDEAVFEHRSDLIKQYL
ncbi:MAG: glycosyltransferase [Rhodobacteraceae bacterium]|nr:glycosyltransferase [Paracoccaceae bacterium]